MVLWRRQRRSSASELASVCSAYRGRYDSFSGALVGMKPSEFAVWMFAQLGARAGDTLDDLEAYDLVRALRLYELAPTRVTERERQAQVIATIGLVQARPRALHGRVRQPAARARDQGGRLRSRAPRGREHAWQPRQRARAAWRVEAARVTQQRALAINPDYADVQNFHRSGSAWVRLISGPTDAL